MDHNGISRVDICIDSSGGILGHVDTSVAAVSYIYASSEAFAPGSIMKTLASVEGHPVFHGAFIAASVPVFAPENSVALLVGKPVGPAIGRFVFCGGACDYRAAYYQLTVFVHPHPLIAQVYLHI